MAQSVNGNMRLGTRLPLGPALPEISTLWLAERGFALRRLPGRWLRGVQCWKLLLLGGLTEFFSNLNIDLTDLSVGF